MSYEILLSGINYTAFAGSQSSVFKSSFFPSVTLGLILD